MSWRLASGEGGSFFFQPLQFHFESPNLLVEFSFLFSLLLFLTAICSLEKSWAVLKQLPFPLADLIGMKLASGSDLINGLRSFSRFQGNLKLELHTVLRSFFCHRTVLHKGEIFYLKSTLFCGPVFGVHYNQVQQAIEQMVANLPKGTDLGLCDVISAMFSGYFVESGGSIVEVEVSYDADGFCLIEPLLQSAQHC